MVVGFPNLRHFLKGGLHPICQHGHDLCDSVAGLSCKDLQSRRHIVLNGLPSFCMLVLQVDRFLILYFLKQNGGGRSIMTIYHNVSITNPPIAEEALLVAWLVISLASGSG